MRVRDGLRRSQSTKMARPPACAISSAKAAANVDFPSFGKDDVKPTISLDLLPLPRSTATLIPRIVSANRENGESTLVQSTLLSCPKVRGLGSLPLDDKRVSFLPTDELARLSCVKSSRVALFPIGRQRSFPFVADRRADNLFNDRRAGKVFNGRDCDGSHRSAGWASATTSGRRPSK